MVDGLAQLGDDGQALAVMGPRGPRGRSSIS